MSDPTLFTTEHTPTPAPNGPFYDFGERVQFTHHLHRRVRCLDGPSYKVLKVWEAEPYRAEGIVLGLRTLADGERVFLGYEEGIAFAPSGHFRAYLIAYSGHHNPVYVLPEHITGRVQ